jgi:HEAT repeat protein
VAWIGLSLALSAMGQEPAAQLAVDPARLAASLGTDPHAATELLHLGAEAVPALMPYLQKKREWPPAEANEAFARTLQLLTDLGPAAGAAVDALVEALDTPNPGRNQAAIFTAIGSIGPWLPRRPTIAVTLGNRCDQGHYFGNPGFFPTISRLAFDPNQDTSSLVQALGHPNGYIREFAAEALARKLNQERPAAPAAKALGKQLREALLADVPTQFNLTWTWNGQSANTGSSFDGADKVRSAISLALAMIEPNAKESVHGHIRLLTHTDPMVRTGALRALGGLGEAAAPAVHAMVLAMSDREPGVAHEAATMLGLLGPAAKEAKDDLIQASKSPDKQLAARAQASLRRIP